MSTELGCRRCGSEEIIVWYSVPERQGIEIHGLNEDGGVSFDFDGIAESSDAESDDEFWCADCELASSNLRYLLGLTDEEFTPKQAIERYAGLLFQVGEIIGDRRDNAYPGYDTPDDPVWAYLHENLSELYDRFAAIIDSVEEEIFGEEEA